MYAERLMHYLTVLKGFDVLAEKSVQVTNKEQLVVWEGYGLRLRVPSNALPQDINQFQLKMAVALSGTFQLPEDGILVSAVYSFSHDLGDRKLRRPVTLEMQHCATTEALDDLCILRGSSHSGKFKFVAGSDFTSVPGYGVIQLHQFCIYATFLRWLSSWISLPLEFCAEMYYTEIAHHSFDVEVYIIRGLEILSQVLLNLFCA